MDLFRTFEHFAYIAIPGGLPEPLWYGIPKEYAESLSIGSVVTIELRHTTKTGIVLKIDSQPKEFDVKELRPHQSNYRFSTQFIQMLERVSENNMCSINKTVQVFFPSKFDSYLDKLDRATAPAFVNATKEHPPLTAEQSSAIAHLSILAAKGAYACALIKGVTGSGKSRVYMELGQQTLDAGKNIIILVPEISLTPQTFRIFSSFFSIEVDIIHSNLGEKQKRQSWLRILTKQCRVLLGTRSALLAPMENVGLIIIDEEHDASFKQHDPAPRYHSRDIAHFIAHQNRALLVLGSATPSLESYYNALSGAYKLIEMNNRVHNRALPKISIVDMKKQRYLQGDKILSIPLREKLVALLDRGEQAIILHNRRGYHTSRICASCGTTHKCMDCDIPLIFHKHSNTMLCHYCSRCYPIALPCTSCGSDSFIYAGAAIEKAEEELAKWIPRARVIRMDRDTTSKKGSAEDILNSFRAGEYNILLGTQMVAKGHDFPGVELVAILSADTGLTVPDFRTNERMFQLITQVAGRAGRTSGAGEVILQTYNPDDPIIQSAIHHDFIDFYTREISERRAVHYPPFVKLVGIELHGKNPKALKDETAKFAQALKKRASQIEAQILGPVDATIAVIKKEHRLKILLKGNAINQLRWLISEALKETEIETNREIALKIDIDPQNTL